MAARYILADACFDGDKLLQRGPWLVTVERGTITAVEHAPPQTRADISDAFLMPGLVEAHAHVFLDGSLTDVGTRNACMQASTAGMLATARSNLTKTTRSGITLVRDAGDRYGINHALREELRNAADLPITLRSPGAALKRAKRYGAFIGHDLGGGAEIVAAVAERCDGSNGDSATSDDIKIILTGVVDFTAGCVKGDPQFDAGELRQMVTEAHKRGRKTFAHCSGVAGLTVAVAAGVDSIEHGYFMNRDILVQMADKEITWVPTFAPVAFQHAAPHHAGWDGATVANIARLLDDHAAHVTLAHEMGVAVLAGSDAGSPGVDHGAGLIDELMHLHWAGMPMQAVLRAATSLPRRLWGGDSARIAKGHAADMILLDRSPFDDPQALREVAFVVKGECCVPLKHRGKRNTPQSRPSLDTADADPIALPCISPCAPER
ncbi:MAG: amidohydrolase family protein [Xanthobacteraceae bacterium]